MSSLFMERALELGWEGILSKGLRPFAAVVTKNGKIVGEGISSSKCGSDPTAHGEVVAIRDAGARLGTWDLSGCEIYTTCEPCSLCVAAIWLSGIKTVHYGYSLRQCEEIGVSTTQLLAEVRSPMEQRRTRYLRSMTSEAEALFDAWTQMPDFKP